MAAITGAFLQTAERSPIFLMVFIASVFFSLDDGGAREDKTVTLNDWLVGFGDWSADGKGLLVPSFTPAGTPVILEVSRTGKASVVLEGAPSTAFDFMIQAPDGHYGILGAAVPGDNNAWMVDNF